MATKTSEIKELSIPALNLERLDITVSGRTPLLTNRFSEQAMKAIEDGQQNGPKVGKTPRNPQLDFELSRHVIDLDAQRFGFPAAGFKKALVSAGGRFADEQMVVLRGVLTIPADLLEIISTTPTMRRDPVCIRGTTWTIAYRAQYMPWSMVVPIVYNANMVNQASVLNLVRMAGQSVGIGAWRVENKGTMGMFEISEVQEMPVL